jgi:hypothetical protein
MKGKNMSIARIDILPKHPSDMAEPEYRIALARAVWGPETHRAHYYGHGRHLPVARVLDRAMEHKKVAATTPPPSPPPRSQIAMITRVVADRLHIHPELITSRNRSHIACRARSAVAYTAYAVFAWHSTDIAKFFNVDRSTAIRLRQRGQSRYFQQPTFAKMCDEAAFITDQAEIL